MLRPHLVERVCDRLSSVSDADLERPWLLAASGGRDSTVLAHILSRAKIPFALAHMNYNLRGDESDRDEHFVRELGRLLEVPVFVERVEAAQMKGNRQAVCRRLRYTWLHTLREVHAYRGILTAHHATDQAETVLMAILKGRGMRARAGMDFRVGALLRPLIDSSTEEIEEYALNNNIQYMNDSSNQSHRYDRNYVRHVLGPLLTARFPHWQEHLLAISSDWRSVSNRLEQSALAVSHRIIVEQTPNLMRWTIIGSIHYGLYLELARNFIPNRNSLKRIGDLLTGAPHRKLTAGAWLITRTANELIWEKTDVKASGHQKQGIDRHAFRLELISPGIYELPGDEKLEYQVWANEQDRSKEMNKGEELWIETTMQTPCIIRYWQAGDRIRMPGNAGRKKVSDLLSECHLPPVRRRNTLVLVQGDEIMWVLGYRSVSFVDSNSEYPRQAFRLYIAPGRGQPSMPTNPTVRI